MMNTTLDNLIYAEQQAKRLFTEIEQRGLIRAHVTEHDVNTQIVELASNLFGIEKYWHKRIVRAGENTLRPYDENPPDRIIEEDDIVFLDFGPILTQWEADFGRTYVVGNHPRKHKLKNDIEQAWHEVKDWATQQSSLTGSQLFHKSKQVTESYGWEFGGEMAGHLIGEFPHEKLEKGNVGLYIHPENHNDLRLPDASGNARHWILEMHFVDLEHNFGGFFEQLLF